MTGPFPAAEINVFGIGLANFVAGMVGGVIRSVVTREQPLKRAVGGWIVGGFVCGYATPVAAPIVVHFLADYGVTADAVTGLTGLLLGLTGKTLCEGVLRLARRWRDDPKIPGGPAA